MADVPPMRAHFNKIFPKFASADAEEAAWQVFSQGANAMMFEVIRAMPATSVQDGQVMVDGEKILTRMSSVAAEWLTPKPLVNPGDAIPAMH